MMRVCFGWVVILLFANVVAVKGEAPANLIAGKKISPSAKLKKGEKVVGWYENKAYLVEVLEVRPNNKLKILWVETKEESDDVAPEELYEFGDSSQMRKSRTAALPEAYRSLDKNGDGQISLSEWNRAKYAEFRKLDKNHDGYLTPKELSAKGATTTAPTAVAASPAKDGDAQVQPAPINLIDYKDKIGQTVKFSLTGNASGGEVRGSGNYSLDSNLAAAAVHAGVLKSGASGQVSVTITGPVERFTASTANGVTSLDRADAGLAFTIK